MFSLYFGKVHVCRVRRPSSTHSSYDSSVPRKASNDIVSNANADVSSVLL